MASRVYSPPPPPPPPPPLYTLVLVAMALLACVVLWLTIYLPPPPPPYPPLPHFFLMGRGGVDVPSEPVPLLYINVDK